MRSVVSCLRSRSTGPSRVRAGLKRQTRPVRDYDAGPASLSTVGASVPRQVLGGELLDLLSDRLRAALAGEEAPARPEPGREPRRFEPVPPRAGSRSRLAPPFPARPIPRAGAPAAGAGAGSGRRPAAQTAGPEAATGRPGGTIPWAPAGNGTAAARPMLAPAGSVSPEAPGGSRPPGSPAGRAAAAIVRILQEYRQLEAAGTGTAEPALGAPGEAPRRDGRPGLPAEVGPVARTAETTAPPWPEMPADAVADRLRQFVSGSRPEAEPTPELVPPVPLFGAGARPAPDGHAGAAVGEEESLTELAEQVTEILYQQVVAYGIDIP